MRCHRVCHTSPNPRHSAPETRVPKRPLPLVSAIVTGTETWPITIDVSDAAAIVVLHAAPEAALRGTLALIRTGDMITPDVEARVRTVDLDDQELAKRRANWTPPALERVGYARMFADHTLQSDQGCDFDFLVGPREAGISRVFI